MNKVKINVINVILKLIFQKLRSSIEIKWVKLLYIKLYL